MSEEITLKTVSTTQPPLDGDVQVVIDPEGARFVREHGKRAQEHSIDHLFRKWYYEKHFPDLDYIPQRIILPVGGKGYGRGAAGLPEGFTEEGAFNDICENRTDREKTRALEEKKAERDGLIRIEDLVEKYFKIKRSEVSKKKYARAHKRLAERLHGRGIQIEERETGKSITAGAQRWQSWVDAVKGREAAKRQMRPEKRKMIFESKGGKGISWKCERSYNYTPKPYIDVQNRRWLPFVLGVPFLARFGVGQRYIEYPKWRKQFNIAARKFDDYWNPRAVLFLESGNLESGEVGLREAAEVILQQQRCRRIVPISQDAKDPLVSLIEAARISGFCTSFINEFRKRGGEDPRLPGFKLWSEQRPATGSHSLTNGEMPWFYKTSNLEQLRKLRPIFERYLLAASKEPLARTVSATVTNPHPAVVPSKASAKIEIERHYELVEPRTIKTRFGECEVTERQWRLLQIVDSQPTRISRLMYRRVDAIWNEEYRPSGRKHVEHQPSESKPGPKPGRKHRRQYKTVHQFLHELNRTLRDSGTCLALKIQGDFVVPSI